MHRILLLSMALNMLSASLIFGGALEAIDEFDLANSGSHAVLKIAYRVSVPDVKIKIPVFRIIYILKLNDSSLRASGFATSLSGFPSDRAMTDAEITSLSAEQPLVDTSVHRSARISVNSSYFRLKVGSGGKLICARAEMWIDGKMVAIKDKYTPSDLSLNGIPNDWYIWNKYPDIMVYVKL